MAEHSRQGPGVPPPDAVGPFASSWRRGHLTVDERVARGRTARQKAPRSSHGQWKPAPDRPDPVTLLEQQAASRVPELVPIRYGRMLASPFTFYRGAALIMAADLAATPVTGITVQLCGDAHLSNFGLFGTPERQMLFDINDFDETLPGPWEWDVKRLAASFEIMGRDRGFSRADRRAVVMAGVREYRSRMRRAAGMGSLDAWYEHFEAGMLLKLVRREVRVRRVGRSEAEAVEEMVVKARTRDSTRVFAKRAEEIAGELRIVADPPVIIPIEDIVRPGSEWENPTPLIKKLLSSYRRTLARHHHPLEEYRYVHAAYKMVGVGSVGTRCYILLLTAATMTTRCSCRSRRRNPRCSRVSWARAPRRTTASAWSRDKADAGGDGHLPGLAAHQGPRRRNPRLLRAPVPDWKGSADVETLLVPGATLYARICGATLARAHARWGGWITIASYLGKGEAFDRAIAGFSSGLRGRNERDSRRVRRRGRLGAAGRPDRGVTAACRHERSISGPGQAVPGREDRPGEVASAGLEDGSHARRDGRHRRPRHLPGVAPAITEVLASWPRLSTLNPWWLFAAIGAEIAHFTCTFALQRLALRTRAWFPVITSQLTGNAITLIMPGGAAVGASLQFRMLAISGMDTGSTVGGLAAFSLLGVGGLLALPLPALPVILIGAPVSRGLEHAALLGAASLRGLRRLRRGGADLRRAAALGRRGGATAQELGPAQTSAAGRAGRDPSLPAQRHPGSTRQAVVAGAAAFRGPPGVRLPVPAAGAAGDRQPPAPLADPGGVRGGGHRRDDPSYPGRPRAGGGEPDPVSWCWPRWTPARPCWPRSPTGSPPTEWGYSPARSPTACSGCGTGNAADFR